MCITPLFSVHFHLFFRALHLRSGARYTGCHAPSHSITSLCHAGLQRQLMMQHLKQHSLAMSIISSSKLHDI